jgi:hypothetical protein
MKSRNAVDTLKGYFYQFDYSIKKLLELKHSNDSITIEKIEDVDIETATDITAIQCKYYAKTEYNHSVIAKPIRLMLSHFIQNRQLGKNEINYSLYGYYNSGQNKLSLPISITDFKDNFLTYTKDKTIQYHHIHLSASDNDLSDFLSLLTIDINAQEYDFQQKSILDLLMLEFSCSEFEAENYYYNNALKLIKQASIKDNALNRRISRKDFINDINSKHILFNKWYVEFKSLKGHFKNIRNEYFTNLNTSPFERLFLFEIDNDKYLRSELKELLLLLSKKWSKISKRESTSFCPYVYLHGIGENELIDLKTELISENFKFVDGFSFFGATFNVKSLIQQANDGNGIKLKFINKKEYIADILIESSKTKELYQFYFKTPYYACDSQSIKNIKIQIKELKNIKEII